MPAKEKINLLPKDEFESSATGKLVKWAVNVGRWIVVLTEFVVICAFLSRFYFDTKLANLFDEVKQKQAIVDSALSFEENFRRLQTKIKIVKSLLAEEKKPTLFITEISQLLPFEISLTKISLNENTLVLTGSAYSERALNVLLSQLITHPKLEEVNLGNISSDKEKQTGIIFNISATVKK